MPPTPPSYSDYSFNMAQHLPEPRESGRHIQSANHGTEISELLGTRLQHLLHNAAPAQHPTYSQENQWYGPMSHPSSAQGPANTRDMTNAPILPPLRIPNHPQDGYQQHLRSKCGSSTAQPQEEKATGGVAAHLDYEMEDMVDFVSETAQGMYGIYCSGICLADIDISRSVVDSNTPVYPEFRKFVSQVLSSTRLPSSTIMFGLHYLATRLTLLSIEGRFHYGSGQLNCMLTTALLLGSKFLDDNTFQNKSWSEVSNIPVRDINVLEMEWLTAIDWNMHVDINDPEGFCLWYQHWERHKACKANKVDFLAKSLSQTHLHQGPMQKQQLLRDLPLQESRSNLPFAKHPMSTGFEVSPHWPAPRYDAWPQLQTHMDYSPPSAPETGPNTPKWYDTQDGFVFNHAAHQKYPVLQLPAPIPGIGISTAQSGHHTQYIQQNDHSSHGSSCPCGYCMSYQERLFPRFGYPQQVVAG